LEIVYSPSELKDTIDKHKDKQLILIDTAGRSQHNEYQLMELHDLLAASSGIEKHLVLSATTKPRDVVDIIRKFSLCAPDRVIFTKTDETSSIGMVLNLLKQYPITLSYFTNGQSVPDDIFPALAKNLADLLLR
jgi:flagellar biosynthesis protein FlhF